MEHYKNLSLEDIEGEVWLPIHGWEGLYEISNMGRVKSFKRKIVKILKQEVQKYDYLQTQFIKLGITTRQKVHRVVAITFIPNPENKPQVNHINGIKHDNRVENLEWCTAHENMVHAFTIGLKRNLSGVNSIRSNLSIENINEIFKLREENQTYSKIGAKFNLTKGAIYRILKKKSWQHIKQDKNGKWYEPK